MNAMPAAAVAAATDWYAPLRSLTSLGSMDEGPGSLAGLAAARKRTLGQFFTPDAVARLMWEIAQQAMPVADDDGKPMLHRYAVLDNSVGSGRLLQFANPEHHQVGGLDVHGPTVDRVKEVFEAAGFRCDFHTGSMEGARIAGYSTALINPPFSLHFESPLLKRFPSNAFGKFGPGTAARSHVYALQQALAGAQVVVALLPRTTVDWIEEAGARSDPQAERIYARWRGTIVLPSGTFRDEGADVEVCIAVFGEPWTNFGRKPARVGRVRLAAGQAVPAFDIRAMPNHGEARIHFKTVSDARPKITRPVTGDPTVRLAHDGRRLRLKFACGFTEARVMNAILVDHNIGNEGERLPEQFRYAGSGRLDLETHVASGDALASLGSLIADIEAAEARVVLAPGLREHLVRRERRARRQATPFAHTIWTDTPRQAARIEAVAKKNVITDPNSWFGWVIERGERVEFARVDAAGIYEATSPKGQTIRRNLDEIRRDFRIESGDDGEQPAGHWVKVHDGLIEAFPDVARSLRSRMRALGIDKWLSWDFQQDDAIEIAMKPRGAIAAWEMALGKTRLAVALALLTGTRRTLVCMDAYLVPEFSGKLAELLPAADWQVLDTREKVRDLRRINLISYERLRSEFPRAAEDEEQDADAAGGSQAAPQAQPGADGDEQGPRRRRRRPSWAKVLRRRFGLVLADEGEIMANMNSAQTRALWQLSPKQFVLLTGTPMGNYPRDLHPLITRAGGDATAAQPWGWRGPRLEPRHAQSATYARRGLDAFREEFVTLEWCTPEFANDNISGGKREIPKIANLPAYRAMLAPHVKRRLVNEPEVTRHVQMPEPIHLAPQLVDFDDAHLSHYLTVCDEFASWWLQDREDEGSKPANLAVLLVRIGAVVRANNVPQHIEKSGRVVWTGGLTSKQRAAVERLKTLAAAGEKVILTCHSPTITRLLQRELDAAGVENVRFDGTIGIASRFKAMTERFRFGSAPILLANNEVSRAGMDMPEATRVLHYDRDWLYTREYQLLCRARRPQSKQSVVAEYLHIRGSIDEYMAQAVAFKRDSFRSGLDWATPELSDAEFLHLETIIGRFVEGLAKLRGLGSGHELREELRRRRAA